MYLIQEHLWPGLAREYRSRQAAAWERLQAGEHEASAALFREAYEVLLHAQPDGHRYHKGEALHNWGLALLWSGDIEGGLRETVAAFVEDAASLAEESPIPEELGRPAAHNLVYAFGLAGPALAAFGRAVRTHITSGQQLPDPTSCSPRPRERRSSRHASPPRRPLYLRGFGHPWSGRCSSEAATRTSTATFARCAMW